MVDIPENEVTEKDVAAWYSVAEQLKKVKASEILLRLRVFNGFFKTPDEGVNNHTMSDGFILGGSRKISREVDEPVLRLMMAPKAADPTTGLMGPSELEEHQMDVNKLIVWKPELKLSEYRKLTDAQRLVFDKLLTIKDGTPALEVKKPSSRGKKSES